MEKRKIRNKKREEKKKLQNYVDLVRVALSKGKMLKKDICEATGLTIPTLNNVFRDDRELYAEYVVLRKTIMDIASDNLVAIVNDPTHPHHFQASKEMLKNFKSDFDSELESSGDILKIESPGGKSKTAVKIVFSSTNSKEK